MENQTDEVNFLDLATKTLYETEKDAARCAIRMALNTRERQFWGEVIEDPKNKKSIYNKVHSGIYKQLLKTMGEDADDTEAIEGMIDQLCSSMVAALPGKIANYTTSYLIGLNQYEAYKKKLIGKVEKNMELAVENLSSEDGADAKTLRVRMKGGLTELLSLVERQNKENLPFIETEERFVNELTGYAKTRGLDYALRQETIDAAIRTIIPTKTAYLNFQQKLRGASLDLVQEAGNVISKMLMQACLYTNLGEDSEGREAASFLSGLYNATFTTIAGAFNEILCKKTESDAKRIYE